MVYNTLKEIKKKRSCVGQCGIIKAKLVFVEVAQPSDFKKDEEEHLPSFTEKYILMRKTLLNIKTEDPEINKIIQDVLEKVKDD